MTKLNVLASFPVAWNWEKEDQQNDIHSCIIECKFLPGVPNSNFQHAFFWGGDRIDPTQADGYQKSKSKPKKKKKKAGGKKLTRIINQNTADIDGQEPRESSRVEGKSLASEYESYLGHSLNWRQTTSRRQIPKWSCSPSRHARQRDSLHREQTNIIGQVITKKYKSKINEY